MLLATNFQQQAKTNIKVLTSHRFARRQVCSIIFGGKRCGSVANILERDLSLFSGHSYPVRANA
jgi:hypothetical protein